LVIKGEIEKLLGYALEKDAKQADYMTIDELMKYSDIAKKIDTAINDSILYKGRLNYSEGVRRAKELKDSKVEITKEHFTEMFLSNYYRQNENKPFIFDENNIHQFNALLLYFMNDPEFENLAPGFSLDKQLHLVGDYGCGKTSMMTAFQSNPKQHFQTIYVPSIIEEFKKAKDEKKFEVLGLYTEYRNIPYYPGNFFNHKKCGICFDDPGKEIMVNNYGENWNLFREILLRRHNDKKSFHGLTHLVTNANKEQMNERYGGDLMDRMKSDFNIILFPNQPSRRD